MNGFIYLAIAALLLAVELLYIRLAKKWNILDVPNERSSHHAGTVRGGGVVFYASCLFFFLTHHCVWPRFMLGMTLIAAVSLVDDVRSVRPNVRLLVQTIGLFLVLSQFGVFNLIGWKSFIAVLSAICILNVYNFMDGINGMTGLYTLIALLTLSYVNLFVVEFIPQDIITYVCLADLVFLCFNFRKHALCFAGDVGAVSLGVIIVYLFGRLLQYSTAEISYMTFLVVYGTDAGFSVIRRLYLKQNIFQPHRVFIFHLLANEGGIPQLRVSLLYAALQLLINVGYFLFPYSKYLYMGFWVVVLLAAHIAIYRYFDKRYDLIK
ncbi:MAG: UDP-GlcNAc--UDP-phosphate GlcNAc-1-phosphate transferase [Bacteroidales bacterium]|nr:UDP-GlcNAc--UDP-phosphate GlcNAc-1-phosphate transferase [Bacteroidales bacterium]